MLLFRLLTGAFPVEGDTVSALRAAHRGGQRRTVRALRPGAPAPLADAIERGVVPTAGRPLPDGGRHASGAGARGAAGEAAPREYRTLASARWWVAAAALVAATSVAVWMTADGARGREPRNLATRGWCADGDIRRPTASSLRDSRTRRATRNSTRWWPSRWSAGAAVVAAAIRLRGLLTPWRARALIGATLPLLLSSLAGGFAKPGTDNAAHIGGAVAGALLGAFLPFHSNLRAAPEGATARTFWGLFALGALGLLVASGVLALLHGQAAG